MFKEWGFLLTEIWFLLALAGLIGLLAGWIIWAGRDERRQKADATEIERLQAALSACEARGGGMAARQVIPVAPVAPVAPIGAVAPVAPVAAVSMALMGGAAATRPAALAAPRGGKADNLKLIKGVGPRLEALCNSLGFWHFDQIANWTAAEVAWVDNNLEGFKGRVSRDEWIPQARDLAAGKPPREGGEN